MAIGQFIRTGSGIQEINNGGSGGLPQLNTGYRIDWHCTGGVYGQAQRHGDQDVALVMIARTGSPWHYVHSSGTLKIGV